MNGWGSGVSINIVARWQNCCDHGWSALGDRLYQIPIGGFPCFLPKGNEGRRGDRILDQQVLALRLHHQSHRDL
jgi:hypothetical protein